MCDQIGSGQIDWTKTCRNCQDIGWEMAHLVSPWQLNQWRQELGGEGKKPDIKLIVLGLTIFVTTVAVLIFQRRSIKEREKAQIESRIRMRKRNNPWLVYRQLEEEERQLYPPPESTAPPMGSYYPERMGDDFPPLYIPQLPIRVPVATFDFKEQETPKDEAPPNDNVTKEPTLEPTPKTPVPSMDLLDLLIGSSSSDHIEVAFTMSPFQFDMSPMLGELNNIATVVFEDAVAAFPDAVAAFPDAVHLETNPPQKGQKSSVLIEDVTEEE